MATLAPLWTVLGTSRSIASSLFGNHQSFEGPVEEEERDLHQLEIENQILKNEIRKMQQLFEHELRIIAQLSNSLNPNYYDLQQHQTELLSVLQSQMLSVPAQVIYRSPTSWSSSLWVGVGENDNTHLGKQIVSKNSPVVIGKNVVGVIDYVGNSQSRVRLITDSGLTPSVRVSRGGHQNQQLKDQIQLLQGSLASQPHIFSTPQEKTEAMQLLESLKRKIDPTNDNSLLAKGELQGASVPLWRAQGQKLKGTGFNYDFSDAEGPARDLRSGNPIPANDAIPTMPIIQEGDTLITTGYDGVFPYGLSVAEVTKIHLLKEGDYYYELEAEPTAGNLNELEIVYILPPVGFDPKDQPPEFMMLMTSSPSVAEKSR
ncbi:MAG: rod shape-determining protein MreC [Chlamydiota bacterium]